MAHRGHKSEDNLEFRKDRAYVLRIAKAYAFDNSKVDPELRERIFIETQENATASIATLIFADKTIDHEVNLDLTPETPQGLVLEDIHGTGAFQ